MIRSLCIVTFFSQDNEEWIDYLLFKKKCFSVKKNDEKYIKIVHGATFSNKILIILIDIEIAAHCAGP